LIEIAFGLDSYPSFCGTWFSVQGTLHLAFVNRRSRVVRSPFELIDIISASDDCSDTLLSL
jgi:hypothetical protein